MEKPHWAILKLKHKMRSLNNLAKEPTFSGEATKHPKSYECKILGRIIGRAEARMGANFISLTSVFASPST